MLDRIARWLVVLFATLLAVLGILFLIVFGGTILYLFGMMIYGAWTA